MHDQQQRKPGCFSKLLFSLRSLGKERETLNPRKIRLRYLHYFLGFPLGMIFINIQGSLILSGISLFGLPTITITFVSFAIGATAMFAFSSVKNISFISRLSAILTMAGAIPWFFLPDGYLAFICANLFMAGVGGCVSSGGFSFVFILNNTERLYGSGLIALAMSLVKLNSAFVRQYPIMGKGLVLLLVAGIAVCMYRSKYQDFQEVEKRTFQKFDPSIWLVLFLFFSYFMIRIIGFYVPEFQVEVPIGWFSFIPILVCVCAQVVLKRSFWTICNLFFILSILSYVMKFAQIPGAVYVFAAVKEIGIYMTFYLIGCVTSKFCDFRMHRLLIIICIALVGIIYIIPDMLEKTGLTIPVAAIVPAALFIIFLLLSPAFSQYLFNAAWSGDFDKLNMSENRKPIRETLPGLEGTTLTPREKQVAQLLLQGMTLKEIAPVLGLTFATVATYSKTIYKKLGINSRAELFMVFGNRGAKEDAGTRAKP